VWLSRRFTQPLTSLARGAEALRSGNLDHRVPSHGDDEFGRVAESMNQMAERIGEQIRVLEADGKRRQQLLADVAHELRSPVASMKTMAEALRDGVASGAERTERASHAIADSAARMERLVNDLLELARLDLDELPLHRQPVDVRAAAADCVRRHREAAEGAGIRVRPLDEGEPALVSADPHRLAQVLDNLLGNAVNHAGEGAEAWVSIEPGDPVTITVADSGRGIAAEHLPYVFDPFYRGDAARTPRDQRSGLGLRIARGLAEAHGGSLRIESIEREGTRAILTLPGLSAGAANATPEQGNS
jgi:signal transduction histidine kinase